MHLLCVSCLYTCLCNVGTCVYAQVSVHGGQRVMLSALLYQSVSNFLEIEPFTKVRSCLVVSKPQ